MDQCTPKQIQASPFLRVTLAATVVGVVFLVIMTIYNTQRLERIEAKLDAPAAYTIPAPADLTPFATSTPSLPRG